MAEGVTMEAADAKLDSQVLYVTSTSTTVLAVRVKTTEPATISSTDSHAAVCPDTAV
jgi:hypothetical protein